MSPPYTSSKLLDTRSERLGAAFVPNQPKNADNVLIKSKNTQANYHKLALKKNTLTLNTSPPFYQSPLGAVPKHNSGGQTGYGYPAENQQLTYNRSDSQAMACNCIIGTLPIGTFPLVNNYDNFYTFGTQTISGDEVNYDPLNLRALGNISTSDEDFFAANGYYNKLFTAFGFNANSLQCPGMLQIEVSMKGQWTGAAASSKAENELTFEARRYKHNHTLLATYKIGNMETGQNFTKSRTKYLRTFDTSNETWNVDDYFKIVVRNTAPPWRNVVCIPHESTVVITYWANP